MIQLLLILMTNAGRLEDRKKKSKKTNKQTKKRKVRPLMDFVIMENEIRATSKHVAVVQKMAIALSTRAHAVVQTLDSAIHRINHQRISNRKTN